MTTGYIGKVMRVCRVSAGSSIAINSVASALPRRRTRAPRVHGAAPLDPGLCVTKAWRSLRRASRSPSLHAFLEADLTHARSFDI